MEYYTGLSKCIKIKKEKVWYERISHPEFYHVDNSDSIEEFFKKNFLPNFYHNAPNLP